MCSSILKMVETTSLSYHDVLLINIAYCIVDLAWENMTAAERNIAQILVNQKYCEWVNTNE